METHFAMINGAGCRFRVTGGTQPPIVFIHELGGSLESWSDLIDLLDARYNCIAYDMRGAGMSEKFRGAFDLDTLADDLRALLRRVDVSGGVTVVAAAAGAAVAVRFATRHPQHVARLVLASPALAVPPERREAARQMADRIEIEGLRCMADAVLPKAFPEQHWTSKETRTRTLARWHGADPEGYAAHYRTIIDKGVTRELANLYCETLVLSGRDDPFNPPEALQQVVRPARNLTFEIVEAGHFMCVQSPQKVAGLIADFIETPVSAAR
ncbi:MAG: alpha/beta fold hydrolase [Pseudomonadota bacterium]|nr:alpha/beta fold hydrolase [Pseudomonadota bacterium]